MRKKDLKIDANILDSEELAEILTKGTFAKDIDDGTIYYNNPDAGTGEIEELKIDSDGYVEKYSVKEGDANFAVSFKNESHQKTTITLNKDKVTLSPKGTYQLVATVTPEEKSVYVEWASDNLNITVVNGLVTVTENAVIGEKGTITAYIDGGVQATCEVTVGTFGKDAFLDKYEEYSNKFNSDSSEYTKDKITIKDKNGTTRDIDSITYYKKDEDRICNVTFSGSSQAPLILSADYNNFINNIIKNDDNCIFSIDDKNNISASNPNHAMSYSIKFNSNGYLLEFAVSGNEYYVTYDGEPEEKSTTINLSYKAGSPIGYLYADNINLNADTNYVLQFNLEEDKPINPTFNITVDGNKISWSEIINLKELEATLDGENINCYIDSNNGENLIVEPKKQSGTLKIKFKMGKTAVEHCSIKTLTE